MNQCANYVPANEQVSAIRPTAPNYQHRPDICVIRASQDFVDGLLANNAGNRTISQGRVKALADDIRNGRWKFNGDSIVVDDDGRLIDGQHRLSAIREAGYPPLDLLVVTLHSKGKESRDVFMTIDCGRPRTMSDTLHVNGTRYAGTAAAVARLIVLIAKGVNNIATKAEMMAAIEAYAQEIERFAPFTQKKNGVIKFQASSVAAMVIAAKDFKAADQVCDFAMRLHTGIGLGADEPERRLLTYLVANRNKHVSSLLQIDTLCTTYRAIFHRLKKGNKPCKSVRGGLAGTLCRLHDDVVKCVGSAFARGSCAA